MKTLTQIINEAEKSKKQKEYQDFFNKKLSDFGVDSPAKLSDSEKKKFFDEVEKEWKGDVSEKRVEEDFDSEDNKESEDLKDKKESDDSKIEDKKKDDDKKKDKEDEDEDEDDDKKKEKGDDDKKKDDKEKLEESIVFDIKKIHGKNAKDISKYIVDIVDQILIDISDEYETPVYEQVLKDLETLIKKSQK